MTEKNATYVYVNRMIAKSGLTEMHLPPDGEYFRKFVDQIQAELARVGPEQHADVLYGMIHCEVINRYHRWEDARRRLERSLQPPLFVRLLRALFPQSRSSY